MRLGGDAVAGVAAITGALAYWAGASAIADSLLADAVGAAGVPKALAILLGGAGALLVLRSAAAPAAPAGSPDVFDVRPLGLIALLAAYVLVLPVIGFPLAITALVGAVAWRAGVPAGARLGAVAAGAGLVFWLAFVKVMGTPLPVWPRWPA